MKRKLASIQRIREIKAIIDADRIEVATILGWRVVVQKGQFKAGDLCIYVEIDAVLPSENFDKPKYKFLKEKKFHIKTVLIRGKPSQGIAFPITIMNELYGINIYPIEGQDITREMGIKQYQYPIHENMIGKIKGDFPAFIPKTKEVRIQTVPDIVEKYAGTKCYISEKIDGESITIFLKDGNLGVCTHKVELEYDEENPIWQLIDDLKIFDDLKDFDKNIAVQGEFIGPGIKKNKYKQEKHDLYLFNLINLDSYKYEDYRTFKEWTTKYHQKTVPILDENYILSDDIKKLEQLASGVSKINKTKREGIVIRPLKEIEDAKLNGRVGFKVIDTKFLTKHKE